MKQFILICGLLLLTGCSHSFSDKYEDSITLIFPQWPPQDMRENDYPQLSRWLLRTGTSESTHSTFLPPETRSYSAAVKRNEPFCAVLIPITKTELPNKTETAYFNAAGVLYPYSITTTGTQITWSQGYLADVMLKIMNSKYETGVSSKHICDFISGFNWKKAQETIDKKINSETMPQYNPWLLDTSNLLNKICYNNFKSTLFNLTGCYSISYSEISDSQNCTFLSAFIPENNNNTITPCITVKKDTPTLISDGKIYGTLITVESVKKISKENIYLPIFIEDI